MSTNSISSLCSTISSYINSDGECNITAEQLATLFVDTNYYNAGETGAAQLEKQIEKLEEAINILVGEAEELNTNIANREDDIDDKSEDLAEVVSSIADEQIEYQIEVKNAARLAAKDAVSSYTSKSNTSSYEQCYSQAFNKRIKEVAGSMGIIKNLYTEYQSIRSSISDICSDIQSDLEEIDLLQGKLNTTNATINLLTITKNNMSSTIENAYSNCDTDTDVPIYSGEKAEIANSLLASYTSRYVTEGDTSTSTTTSSEETKTEAQEYLLSLKEGTYTSGDKYSVDTNPELANLRELYESGELQKLQQSGMTVDEILTFISENWNVGITKDSDGNWKIPKGHSSDQWVSEGVYTYLAELVENSTTYETADDVNQTQMAELAEFIENGELTNLYEAGFTFKEAMYLLTQLFPDAGIVYDLDDQDGTRTYSIVSDTDASGDLYATIAAQILEYWNVGGEAATEEDTSTTGETTRYDPITFTNGSYTYTFLSAEGISDGTFDYTDGSNNDLLGSTNGISELFAYDYNGDGVIDENDVDEDGNCALDQITLLVNNQIESVSNSEQVDDYAEGDDYTNSVSFDVSYTSASLAGITSIDLTQYLATDEDGNYITDEDGKYVYSDLTGTGDDISDTTKDYDNVTEAYDDINGSSVINSFSITFSDGSTVTANETLNTESNLETFYKQIADNDTAAITSSISQEEYNNAIIQDGESSDDVDWTSDEAKAVYDSLESAKATLEAQKESAQSALDNYDIGESYSNFIKLVGTDGTSGEYIKAVKNAAIDAIVPDDPNDEEEEDYREDSDGAADAAEEAAYEVMEKYFGSDTVEDVKEDK